MAAALSAVRGALAGLSPRERRLLAGLASLLLVALLVIAYFLSASALDELEHQRADTVEALRLIQRVRPQIAARTARRDALLLRYRTRAPALTSFVEEQAHAANVQVAEAQDRPPTPSGRRFSERSVSIRLRQVHLEALADFMDRIEQAPFPVAITSVRIHRRFGESNSYDVDDMVITTWDQTPGAGERRRTTPSTGSGTGTPDPRRSNRPADEDRR